MTASAPGATVTGNNPNAKGDTMGAAPETLVTERPPTPTSAWARADATVIDHHLTADLAGTDIRVALTDTAT